MDEAGEVEDVRPEEDAARGARPQWETEKPLERRRLRSAEEPSGFADFRGGWEQDAGEDGGGDDGHGEAVNGGDGAQRDGPVTAEEERQEEVEQEG